MTNMLFCLTNQSPLQRYKGSFHAISGSIGFLFLLVQSSYILPFFSLPFLATHRLHSYYPFLQNLVTLFANFNPDFAKQNQRVCKDNIA
jgi:hypothetical protein